MKVLARHLTVDLFDCKSSALKDYAAVQKGLDTLAERLGLVIVSRCGGEAEENHFAAMLLFVEGHITLHIYTALRYVAADIFLCGAEDETAKIAEALRDFFQPDKTKSVLLRRGDFGSAKDIRPKVRTHVAPLRRVKNTGVKVIRALARKGRR